MESLTVVELKDKLRDLGLPVSGAKAVLIERLKAAKKSPKKKSPKKKSPKRKSKSPKKKSKSPKRKSKSPKKKSPKRKSKSPKKSSSPKKKSKSPKKKSSKRKSPVRKGYTIAELREMAVRCGVSSEGSREDIGARLLRFHKRSFTYFDLSRFLSKEWKAANIGVRMAYQVYSKKRKS